MAEHAPTPTPQTEEMPTVAMPALEAAPEADLDPSVTLKLASNMKPEKMAETLAARLKADASLRGFNDIQGLDLTLRDDRGDRHRYVVAAASSQPVDKKVKRTRKLSLPRIQGQLFDSPSKVNAERAESGERPRVLPKFRGRKAVWARPNIDSEYKTVGMPRLVKHGSSRNIDRRREPIKPTYKQFVTVGIYEEVEVRDEDTGEMVKTWEHVETNVQPVDDFYKEVGATLTSDNKGGNDDRTAVKSPTAMWHWRDRLPGTDEAVADPARDLEIGLTRGDVAVFEDVTRQLEAGGITNWAGLTWQLEISGRNKIKGVDGKKKGVEVRSRTQQVLQDRTDKEEKADGDGYKYVRKFIIRTVEEYEDGDKIVVNEGALKDYELWHYFEDPNDFANIPYRSTVTNMRMPGARRTTEEELEDSKVITDRLAYADNVFVVTGGGEADHDFRRPILEEALGMISMRGASYPTTKKGYEALSSHIAFAMEGEERKLGEELQAILSEVGFTYFDDAVKEVHGVIHQELEGAMERLGLEVTDLETRDFWVAEGLLERSAGARAEGEAMPFIAVLESPSLLRDIIDEHVGEMFGHASIISEKATVSDGTDEDGKPKMKEKIFHEFNKELFEPVRLEPTQNLKGQGSYAVTKDIRKWRDKIWKPIRKQAREVVYEQLVETNSVDYEEAEKLGRLLRRTIGE